MSNSELIDLSRDFLRQGHAHAWATVIAVQSPSSAYIGAQAIVEADGTIHGWVGGGCVQGAVKAAAMRAIAADRPVRLRLSNDGNEMEGVDVQPMLCASNGEVELFIQPAAVAPRLRVYGGTPAARAAAWFAREAGFEVSTDATIAEAKRFADALGAGAGPLHLSSQPEPEAYALIATQGDNDELALEDALRSGARAVLVVASRRKAERLRTVMRTRGIDAGRLDDLYAPAGPDLGAVTPNEIALSAVAGLVALRRGKRAVGRLAGPETQTKAHGQAALPAVAAAGQAGYVNPVCGAVVDPAKAMTSLTMEGQTHHFCCTGCRTEFERDPAKYLAIGARMRSTGEGVGA